MSDYKQTRDAAGNVTSQYGQMLRNLDDEYLVERLHNRRVCSPAQNSCRNDHVLNQAADRIEELKAENKRLTEQLDAIEEMGTESLNALPDCLMRLAPALVENDELKAKLAEAEGLLVDAMVQLENGKIKTRRNCAFLIGRFLAELKGTTDGL